MGKLAAWFRFYVDTPDDLKIRSLPKGDRWIWAALMCLAKESPEPGRLLIKGSGLPVTLPLIADKAGPGYTAREVDAALGRFLERAMVHREGDSWVLTHFRARQFLSDSSTPRVAALRERRKGGGGNADETFQERSPICRSENREQSTEDRSPSEHYSETQPAEQDMLLRPREAASPPDPISPAGAGRYSADFDAFWPVYPRHRDKQPAFAAYEKLLKRGHTPAQIRTAAGHFAAYVEANGIDDEYVPYAATWMNEGKWLDFRDGVPDPPVRRGPAGNGRRAPLTDPMEQSRRVALSLLAEQPNGTPQRRALR